MDSFPGNVRGLQAMIYNTVSGHKGKILSLNAFKPHVAQQQEDGIVPVEPESERIALFASCRELPTIKHAKELLVSEAMRRAHGNQSIAARMLGISHQALSKRLKSKN